MESNALNFIFIVIAVVIFVYDFTHFVVPSINEMETTRKKLITSILGDVTAVLLIFSVINGFKEISSSIGFLSLVVYLIVLLVMEIIVRTSLFEDAADWLEEEIIF